MNMFLILLTYIFSIILGIASAVANTAICEEVEIEYIDTFSITCQNPNDTNHIKFILSGKSENGESAPRAYLSKIEIKKDGLKLQKIEIEGFIWLDSLEKAIEFMDINFDGYYDVKLWTRTSAGPNSSYEYFLYDTKTKQFIHSDLGDKLSGFDIIPDSKTKTITVTSRSSCCDWTIYVYKWVGKELCIQTIIDEGEFDAVTIPILKDKFQGMLCLNKTSHYDLKEKLLSIEITSSGLCEGVDKSAVDASGLLNILRENQNGYSIKIKDKNNFTINF